MRVLMAIFWLLVVGWLLTAKEPVQAAPPPSPVPWPHKVEGNYCVEEADKTKQIAVDKAKQIALEKARVEIVKFLHAQDPPLTSWQPSADYIRTHLLAGEGGEDLKEGGYTFKKWVLTLRPDLDEFRRLDRRAYLEQEANAREARRGGRVLMAAKLTAGCLAFLIALLGYIRLDEHTRGAHTRWLRAGLGTSLLAAGVGLWLV